MIIAEKILEFKAMPTKCLFNGDNFKIYACSVNSFTYPDVKVGKYGTASIKGDIQELNIGCEYLIKGEEVQDKYGYGYNVMNIRAEKPNTIESSRNFLREILTWQQADTLISVYPDIIDRIMTNKLDDIDLNKTKGIKEYTFNVIKKKVIENFKLAELVDEFSGIFSISIIKKLYSEYTSIQKIRENLHSNPYECLCRLGGVGFKTADELLVRIDNVSKRNIKEGKKPILDFQFELLTSFQRMKACALYVLDENETAGNTYMSLKMFQKECLTYAKEAANNLAPVIKGCDEIFFDKDTLRISKKQTYDTELFIAEKILNGLKNNRVWDIDTKKYRMIENSELTDDQMKTMEYVCKNNIVILQGTAGCVDCDTEFFNGTRWKPISEYVGGEKVLQYNTDGTAALVYPINYIKQKSDTLWHFETKYGLDQCLSDNHTCYYITSKGNLFSRKFKEIREAQTNNKNGFLGKFITSYNYEGKGINLSDDEIRMMVAVFADGSFYYRDNCSDITYTQSRFHIKKRRKKDRLQQLANNLNLPVRIEKSANEGYDDFYIKVPFRAKHFPSEWYNCNKHQMEIIADEIINWDCSYKKANYFSTTEKNDADFIQFVFSSLGYRATIQIQDRVGQMYLTNNKKYTRKSIEYTVSWTKRNLIGFCTDSRENTNKTKITPYKTIDGYEYCFTVPSHILVLRRKNKIFITGNCGKSFSAKALINMLNDNNKSSLLLAPTGRAAKVLQGYTGHAAMTIHRGLGFMPPNEWRCDKDNPIPYDMVILDETSMADVNLFKHLLEAINFERTKLLLIGDDAQIPSVSCGNLLHDLLNSKVVPTVYLTKVFRYGIGGLSTVATDIRNSNQSFDSTKDGLQIIGEDKGLTLMPIIQDKAVDYIVKMYQKLLKNGIPLDDILVLSSQNVGNYGTQILNNAIQEAVNPNEEYIKYGEVEYRKGDPIIQCVNDYKAVCYHEGEWSEEDTTFISNGEIGRILEVKYSDIIVDFNGVYIIIPKTKFQNIKLGYAISIHKSQGGQAKHIIVFAPKAHTFMLNSNLLYVAVTRAKERCYLITDLNTYNKAIKKKENFDRKTWLCDLLIKEELNG